MILPEIGHRIHKNCIANLFAHKTIIRDIKIIRYASFIFDSTQPTEFESNLCIRNLVSKSDNNFLIETNSLVMLFYFAFCAPIVWFVGSCVRNVQPCEIEWEREGLALGSHFGWTRECIYQEKKLILKVYENEKNHWIFFLPNLIDFYTCTLTSLQARGQVYYLEDLAYTGRTGIFFFVWFYKFYLFLMKASLASVFCSFLQKFVLFKRTLFTLSFFIYWILF